MAYAAGGSRQAAVAVWPVFAALRPAMVVVRASSHGVGSSPNVRCVRSESSTNGRSNWCRVSQLAHERDDEASSSAERTGQHAHPAGLDAGQPRDVAGGLVEGAGRRGRDVPGAAPPLVAGGDPRGEPTDVGDVGPRVRARLPARPARAACGRRAARR